MAELRTGNGFRVRCLSDDGSTDHVAVDLHGRIDLKRFVRAVKALGRCACGAPLHMLGADAPEPSKLNAARKAANLDAVKDTVTQGARVKWGRSVDALGALFADGRERANREVAEALGVSDTAVCQLLRRSGIVERVRQGVWRLRAADERTNRADVRLTDTASQLVNDNSLLRDDVLAVLGRASMDGKQRATVSGDRCTVVFMLSGRMRDDVYVWSATTDRSFAPEPTRTDTNDQPEGDRG